MSDFLYILLNYSVGYRKEVVYKNLKNAFPEKKETEIKTLANRFYRHLSDIFIEAILNLRLSRKQVVERYKFLNPELVNQYYDQGKSVVLLSAHYNNWEYMVLSLNLQLKHYGIGVGKPLSNKKFGEILTKFRTRYGTEVIDSENVREKFRIYDAQKQLSAYMMLSDQSPNNTSKCYWINFLNQETGFIFGGEHFAKKYNYPVLFYAVKKIKRGYYEIEFQLMEENPETTEFGQITEKYVHLLENLIKKEPQYWLWSHKRWKHKKPSSLG